MRYTLNKIIYFLKHPKSFLILRELKLKEDNRGYCFKGFIETKSIFIHIPKAAGISVNYCLYGNKGGGHISAKEYQIIFSKKNFNNFYKFAIVRNPFDRLLSAYNFLKKGGISESDYEFLEKYISCYLDFEDFVLNGLEVDAIKSYIHFIPQANFVCDNNFNIIVDYIGYFENLEAEFDYISTKIKPKQKLKKLNSNSKSQISYHEFYTPLMRQKVEKIYATDLKLFNYSF